MSAPQVEKLESDVTREEAEGLITFVQTVSTSFRGYSEEDRAVTQLRSHRVSLHVEASEIDLFLQHLNCPHGCLR